MTTLSPEKEAEERIRGHMEDSWPSPTVLVERDDLDTILSALPPPVPAEEGGERRCKMCGTGQPEHDVEFCQLRKCPYKPQPRLVTEAAPECSWPECSCNTITPDPDRCEATQAPQDVAGLVEGVAKIINPKMALGGVAAWEAHSKANAIISALRPSPISHESKGLELAAADDNHKALVEALTKIARAATGPHHCEGLGGVDPDCARASETVEIAKAALAAFQSRQEGK